MKPAPTSLLGVAIFAAMSSSSFAGVVAFWDFNNGYAAADLSPQIVHPATSGTGTLYQQRADTDGNGKGGVAFADVPLGINAAAGQSIAWDDLNKTGANDAEIFVTFSTTNIKDLVVSFDLRGNTGIVPSFDLKYALTALVDVTNPTDVTGTIKDFSGVSDVDYFGIYNNYSVNAVASFTRVTLDLSGITALNNSAVVALRFDDWSNGTGNNDMRIDNFLVTGTAVPEPSSALLGLLGLTALLRRRR